MRKQILKLRVGKSTRAERVFMEILKDNHIPFKAKIKIGGREVDFLVGKFAIEINGHDQDPDRNNELISLGYVPIHIANSEVMNNRELLLEKLNLN